MVPTLLGTLVRDYDPFSRVFHNAAAASPSGLLFMFYVCVNILFWRVFMRISYACPAHLKFALSVEKWTELVHSSRQVIDWLDAHERLYDVWLLVAYCATSCALVQVRYMFVVCCSR